jgi:hypothetical protein
MDEILFNNRKHIPDEGLDGLPMFATPPTNGTANSAAAAATLDPDTLNERQHRVLNAIWKARRAGITDEQIEDATGLKGDTVRPRRGELWEYNWIVARRADNGAPILWHPDKKVRAARLNEAQNGTTRAGNAAHLWFPSQGCVNTVYEERAA